MSLMKKAIGGSIHRIREFELEKVNLADEFDILQIVGEGWFGKILLTEHRSTQTEMVLKALPKVYTGVTDFYREFHYGLHLSAHRNIITTYDVAFETAGFYIFSQEYAPLGDLTSNVTETGLGELHAKRVARQLAAAVHHIHSRELVHRDIKLDNILVFRSDFSRIKLCDFGETRRANTIVRRHNEWLPYSPPEVLQIDTDETYKALTSHDVWQFGIVLFVCLTGCIPWQKAAMDDRRYTRYLNWHTATLNIAKKPKLFQLISSRAQRMFKRLLEPRLEKRPVSVLEINKYLEDRWLAKLGAEKALNGGADERDELSPSMYSFHSSLEEKNQLLYTLTQYGIETTVDRTRKKDRIREWIESSAIAEENEDEESDIEDIERQNGNSEIDEDTSMKGRHYPERRPSLRATPQEASTSRTSTAGATPASNERTNDKTDTVDKEASGKTRRANTILSSNHRAARTLRRTERRNPFAPQVAQERHTVARFASFPNGDPNLAVTSDRATILTKNPVKLASPVGSANDSIVFDDSTTRSRSFDVPNDFIERDSARNSPLRKIAKENGISDRGTYEEERSMSRNPQIPVRKNRSQTAPFPSAIPPQQQPRINNDYEGETQAGRNAVVSLAAPRAASEPTIVSPLSNVVNNNNNVYVNNNNNSSDSSNSSNNNNPLTMTVASHLVMQSFNALQAMNTVPKINKATNDKHSSGNKVAEDFGRERSAKILGHGKDAYEHYKIVQRPVGGARNDLTRQGSSGSGSRSVSN